MSKKMKLLVVAFLTVVGLTFAVSAIADPTQHAGAAPVSGTPDAVWDVDGKAPSVHTDFLRSIVFDFEELDGWVYVGGKFTEVVSPSRANRYRQPYLAAFNMRTGQWRTDFTPNVGGPIYALDVRSDGMLVVAGEFEGGVKIIDPNTCLLYTSPSPRDATLSRMPSSA